MGVSSSRYRELCIHSAGNAERRVGRIGGGLEWSTRCRRAFRDVDSSRRHYLVGLSGVAGTPDIPFIRDAEQSSRKRNGRFSGF